MEVVMQMMYSYSLELLAAAVGLMLLLELVTRDGTGDHAAGAG